MKRVGSASSAPVVPGGSPDWFQAYGRSNSDAIRDLLKRIADLEARLKAAGIA